VIYVKLRMRATRENRGHGVIPTDPSTHSEKKGTAKHPDPTATIPTPTWGDAGERQTGVVQGKHN